MNLPTNIALHFVAMQQMTVEEQSDKLASDMEVCIEQSCGIYFLHVEEMAPTGVHQCLLNADGDQTVNVSRVRW